MTRYGNVDITDSLVSQRLSAISHNGEDPSSDRNSRLEADALQGDPPVIQTIDRRDDGTIVISCGYLQEFGVGADGWVEVDP